MSSKSITDSSAIFLFIKFKEKISLPKKCCFSFSLQQGVKAIIFFDVILLFSYVLMGFGLTLVLLAFNITATDNHYRVVIPWSLLSVFLANFFSGSILSDWTSEQVLLESTSCVVSSLTPFSGACYSCFLLLACFAWDYCLLLLNGSVSFNSSLRFLQECAEPQPKQSSNNRSGFSRFAKHRAAKAKARSEVRASASETKPKL